MTQRNCRIQDSASIPAALPVVGHLPYFLRDKLGFLDRCAASGQAVIPLQIGRQTYLLTSPEDIRHVLEVNHANYIKSPRMSSSRGQWLSGQGVLTTSGLVHAQQRQILRPLFMKAALASFAKTIVKSANELLAKWMLACPAEQDMADVMMSLTHRIIGEILFDLDFDSDAVDLGQAVLTRRRYIQYWFSSLLPMVEYWPLPINSEYRQAMKLLDGTIAQLISARRQHPDRYTDLLSLLVQSRYRDGTGMSDRQIRDEALTLSITGYETIGEAMTWTWYLLSLHPSVEAKLWQELQTALGGRSPTVEDIPNLPYTRSVLDEAIRLYPPTWIYIRIAQQSDRLPSGATIPIDAKLYLSPYVMHRHPQYFPAPQRFDPERFHSSQKRERPKFAYFPFGGGPRVCIGQSLAEMEGVLLLATIAQQVRLTLGPNQVIVPEPGITLHPKNGLRMQIEPRSTTS